MVCGTRHGCLKYVIIMAGRQPHMWWAISFTDLNFRISQSDQPGVLLPGTDVINSSDPWCVRKFVELYALFMYICRSSVTACTFIWYTCLHFQFSYLPNLTMPSKFAKAKSFWDSVDERLEWFTVARRNRGSYTDAAHPMAGNWYMNTNLYGLLYNNSVSGYSVSQTSTDRSPFRNLNTVVHQLWMQPETYLRMSMNQMLKASHLR